MPYFVYILECSDKTYYCGYTNNIEKRIKNHNEGKTGAKYTRSKRPVVLKYFEIFNTLSEALKREYLIKKLTHTQKAILIEKGKELLII
jgi:predicted GIY-YIG superfamily endonuclease